MKTIVVLVLAAAILLILTACTSQQNSAQSTVVAQSFDDETQIIVDPCEKLDCGVGKECIEGSCVCKKDLKECNNACIPENKCCSDSECREGKSCDNGKCRVIPFTCEFNEQFDLEKETCVCVPGTKRCDAQEKCIPNRNCCIDSDCSDRDNKCSPTKFAANVCLRDPLDHCRSVPEDSRELFSVEGGIIKISVHNITEKGAAKISVEDKNISTTINSPVEISTNRKVLVSGVKIFGGTCKD